MPVILSSTIRDIDYKSVVPYPMCGKTTDIAPIDPPAGSSYFFVDRHFDMPYYDGEGKWYLSDGKFVEAGQPFTKLFE